MPEIGIPVIVLLSLGSAALAMAGFVAVRRFSKPLDLDEHQTFIDAMCNIVGTLVSILLGLLVASALDNYQSLEQTIDLEANAVAEIFRLSRGLPDPLQGQVQTLCERYSQEVVHKEWPTMASGKPNAEVFVTYTKIVDAIVRYKPIDQGQSNVQTCLLQSVATNRRLQAHSHPCPDQLKRQNTDAFAYYLRRHRYAFYLPVCQTCDGIASGVNRLRCGRIGWQHQSGLPAQ